MRKPLHLADYRTFGNCEKAKCAPSPRSLIIIHGNRIHRSWPPGPGHGRASGLPGNRSDLVEPNPGEDRRLGPGAEPASGRKLLVLSKKNSLALPVDPQVSYALPPILRLIIRITLPLYPHL